MDRWTPVFRERGWKGDFRILNIEAWGPDEAIVKLFNLFGAEAKVRVIPTKNENAALKAVHVDHNVKESLIHKLLKDGQRIFVFDSISAPIKAFFEISQDLRGNLPNRDACFSTLLIYINQMCKDFGATVLLVDHASEDPTNPYAKPHPYGPQSLQFLAKYWLLLSQSDAKEHTDVHQLTLTRNVYKREYEESYWLRLTDKGFVDMGAEEVQAMITRRKK